MIIINISMNPSEYGYSVSRSQAAKIARAINKAVQKHFPQIIIVFKLALSTSIISNDPQDTEKMIDEVKTWLVNNQPEIARKALV